MPIENLGKTHLTPSQINQLNQAFDTVASLLSLHAQNLTAAERTRYGRVNEQNKLLIDKVKDYHQQSPELASPEVNWAEFAQDYSDRKVLSQLHSKLKMVETMLLNTKILRDYDNHTDALRDYKYAQYKNCFANAAGYEKKIDELKVFFPKTGKKKKKK